ncbi:hypothetical protein H0H92_000714 [Tricholoma furcatifolium]|nr:hypothetical protein H0H92_000714 [Tricholoma furcatifolium]
MQAVRAELKGEPGELQDEKFDVVICASAYHHFPDIASVTRTLAYFLKSGGALIIVDIAKRPGENPFNNTCYTTVTPQHVVDHIVPHQGGLDESDMRAVFENAGLLNQSFTYDDDSLVAEHDVRLFIAKGVKQA